MIYDFLINFDEVFLFRNRFISQHAHRAADVSLFFSSQANEQHDEIKTNFHLIRLSKIRRFSTQSSSPTAHKDEKKKASDSKQQPNNMSSQWSESRQQINIISRPSSWLL